MGRLEGKTALITGSARGVGEAAARLFVSEGAQVVVSDLLDELGTAVAADLGDSAAYVHLDVTQEEMWAAAVRFAQERFGKLDVLVNNAGLVVVGTIENLPLEDYHRSIAVNQTGTWLGMRAAAPALRAAGGGSIVNVSTTAAYAGNPSGGAYGCAKWAVRGMSKTAAIEFAADRIRVNCVHPGVILTQMLIDRGHWIPEKGIDPGRLVPAGRSATPGEVADLLLYVASDESRYCTGSDFVIDGGGLAGPFPRDFMSVSD